LLIQVRSKLIIGGTIALSGENYPADITATPWVGGETASQMVTNNEEEGGEVLEGDKVDQGHYIEEEDVEEEDVEEEEDIKEGEKNLNRPIEHGEFALYRLVATTRTKK